MSGASAVVSSAPTKSSTCHAPVPSVRLLDCQSVRHAVGVLVESGRARVSLIRTRYEYTYTRASTQQPRDSASRPSDALTTSRRQDGSACHDDVRVISEPRPATGDEWADSASRDHIGQRARSPPRRTRTCRGFLAPYTPILDAVVPTPTEHQRHPEYDPDHTADDRCTALPATDDQRRDSGPCLPPRERPLRRR